MLIGGWALQGLTTVAALTCCVCESARGVGGCACASRTPKKGLGFQLGRGEGGGEGGRCQCAGAGNRLVLQHGRTPSLCVADEQLAVRVHGGWVGGMAEW